jgi:imidazolonepropionase-like amidohydrolase
MSKRWFVASILAVLSAAAADASQPGPAQRPSPVTAIRAGQLLDPEAGTTAANQVILVQDGRIAEVGSSIAIPPGATIIDLSGLTVLPGLVDAHNHLALTYKAVPENNVYYYTYVADSTPLRAIQAVSNGIQMLASGFTIVRDMGNNGNYADTALRVAIEQGWVPGPTIVNSGIIIGGMGGQFSPTPEMAMGKNIVYPEYLDADTHDEIIKAIRQNILFGAKVIKICVDCKPYGYTTDEIRLFISESAKAGLKVEGHCQTVEGARRAIEAGIWSIAHDSGLNDELHKLMATRGIWRAGTETPISLVGHTTQARYDRTVAGLKNAWQNKTPLTFSTDADYWVPDARRSRHRVHRDMEGRRYPAGRHPACDDHQRLQGQRDGAGTRADPERAGGRSDCCQRQPARDDRRSARRALRHEGRYRVQTGWRDDARPLLQWRAGQRVENPVAGTLTLRPDARYNPCESVSIRGL